MTPSVSINFRMWAAALFAVNLGLGVFVANHLNSKPRVVKLEPPAGRSISAAKRPVSVNRMVALGRVEKFSAISARPLFSSTRRPTKPPPPVRPVAKKPLPMNLILYGVIIGADQKFALIRSEKSTRLQQVPEGRHVDGWLVDRIFPDHVVLRSDERTTVLQLWRIKGKFGPGPKTSNRRRNSRP